MKRNLKAETAIAGIYLITAVSWIYFTDRLVPYFAGTKQDMVFLETYKGIFYVLVTTFLLYLLVRRYRKRVEAERGKFRAIFEEAGDAILIADETGYIDCNPVAQKMFGYTLQDFMRRRLGELSAVVQPDGTVSAVKVSEYAALARHGNPQRFEWKAVRKDGTLFDADFSMSAIHWGSKTAIQLIVRDMTESKIAEKALRDSEEKFRTICENAPVMIDSFDENGKCLMWNKECEKTLGWTMEDICTSEDPLLLCYPDPEERNKILGYISHADGLFRECNAMAKDGLSHVQLWANFRLPNGSLISIGHDITDRKLAEKALLESDERLQLAIEGSNGGVLDWNLDSNEVFYSHSLKEMLGYDENEMGNGLDEWTNRIHPDDKDRVKEEIEKYLRGELPLFSAEHRINCKDGTFKWVLAQGKMVSCNADGLPHRIVGTVTDITERKELELQLYQAQKMEAIGQLAGGIAHDFNNILTAIIGFSQLLAMKMADDDPKKGYTEQIRNCADRAAELAHALLAFSRKQVMVPKAIDLNETIVHLNMMLRRLVSANIDLNVETAPQALTVLADSGKIEQVIMNLVTNAKDAMPDGGKLTIATCPMIMDGEFINAYGYGKPGNYACITVSDTGHGMDRETEKHIFEPFFTTKEVGKGTGLGLSIVYGIVKQHNGYISVNSVPNKGTAFKIFLPLTDTIIEPQIPADETSAATGTETILLAEDDSYVRDCHHIMLEEAGYKVIDAVNGEDALDKFEEFKCRINLILMDVMMPKMDGWMVCETMMKKKPEMKILFISGYPRDIFTESKTLPEKIELLMKPVHPGTLLRKVRQILDR